MRNLVRLMTLELVPDVKLARFATGFCWFGAVVTLVLGFRYIGQLGLPGPQHLLGLAVLLILCLAAGAVGMLAEVHATLKARRVEAAADRGS